MSDTRYQISDKRSEKHKVKRFLYIYACLVNIFVASAGIAITDTVKSTYTVTGSIKSTATQNVDIYVHIYADEMVYDNKTETVLANGSVKVYYGDMELYADNVEYIKREDFVNAWGNVNFRKEGYTLEAEEMYYNIKTSTGTAHNTTIKAPPMFVFADKVIIKSKGEFFVPSGDITTCSHEPPHYKFRGRKLKLKLKERFSARSAVLFIKGIPAFFYPYYSRKLGPRKLQIDMDIGTSSRDGNFIRSKVSYPFTRNARSYFGLDLMSKRGTGFKAGHGYSTDEGVSKVDIYYIREREPETGTLIDKGTLYAKGWQEIAKYLSVRYRTEYTSDYAFNYDYNQQVYEYKTKDLYYQLGLEYSRAKYLISVYGDKKEEWEVQDYRVIDLVAPGAKFMLFPVYIPGRIRFQGNTHYINKYYPATETSAEQWQSSISWETKIDKTYRLNVSRPYYVTLSPGFGFDGMLRKSLRRYISMFLSMQHGLYSRIFLDTDYVWKRSVEYPYRIMKNIMKYEVTYRQSSRFMVSSESSYDFREEINKPAGNFFTRLNMRYRSCGLYVRNRYNYYEKESLEWLYELDIRSFSQTRVKYSYLYPTRLEIGQRFNFRRGPYILSLGTRFYVDKNTGFYKFTEFIEKSLSLRWNMHCWESEFRFLRRGAETEFWVLFNISAFQEPKVGIYGNLLYNDYRYHRE